MILHGDMAFFKKDIHKLGLRGRLPTFNENFLADPHHSKIVSEYGQKIPQSQTEDNPMAP